MKCLIIASGKGTRLASKGSLKPLVSLMGLPLIARVILRARRAGLEDFCVVTGYRGKELQENLRAFGKRREIKITCLQNDEWEKENGVSALKARDVIKDNFILLMSDHIFNEGIIRRLREIKIRDSEVILAIDPNITANHYVDHDDATRVYVEDSKVLNIGKNISKYNGFDTGIFLCSPIIFGALQNSIKEGDSTLSGGIRLLAKAGKARACRVDDYCWIDVDDEQRLAQAERYLMNLRGKKPSDGVVTTYINRPISMRITKFLLRTRIKPNHITFFCFATSVLGALFFFLGGYFNLLIGGALAQISSIIDGCDGEIARLKFLETEFGGWFDAVLDRYADAFLLLGLTYYVYRADSALVWMFIGFLAIIGSLINSYTADKYDSLMKSSGRRHFRIGRDLRILIIFVGSLLNQPALALLAIAATMNIENIRRVIVLARD